MKLIRQTLFNGDSPNKNTIQFAAKWLNTDEAHIGSDSETEKLKWREQETNKRWQDGMQLSLVSVFADSL